MTSGHCRDFRLKLLCLLWRLGPATRPPLDVSGAPHVENNEWEEGDSGGNVEYEVPLGPGLVLHDPRGDARVGDTGAGDEEERQPRDRPRKRRRHRNQRRYTARCVKT